MPILLCRGSAAAVVAPWTACLHDSGDFWTFASERPPPSLLPRPVSMEASNVSLESCPLNLYLFGLPGAAACQARPVKFAGQVLVLLSLLRFLSCRENLLDMYPADQLKIRPALLASDICLKLLQTGC